MTNEPATLSQLESHVWEAANIPRDPKFTDLGERLARVKERHEQGFTTSLDFLRDARTREESCGGRESSRSREDRDRAKKALTELFNEAKGKNTLIIVERIVADIDDIVKKVRFPDWQLTN